LVMRVKPGPGVVVAPKLLVPIIASRKEPVWKGRGEVEMDVPVPELVAFAAPTVVTPETS